MTGVVDHHEATATDAGGKWLGHTEHGGRRHRSVHRIPTLPENPSAFLCRQEVDRSDRTPLADGNRLLDEVSARGVGGGRHDGG